MNKVCLNCQKTLIRTQRKFCSDKCFMTPRKKIAKIVKNYLLEVIRILSAVINAESFIENQTR